MGAVHFCVGIHGHAIRQADVGRSIQIALGPNGSHIAVLITQHTHQDRHRLAKSDFLIWVELSIRVTGKQLVLTLFSLAADRQINIARRPVISAHIRENGIGLILTYRAFFAQHHHSHLCKLGAGQSAIRLKGAAASAIQYTQHTQHFGIVRHGTVGNVGKGGRLRLRRRRQHQAQRQHRRQHTG